MGFLRPFSRLLCCATLGAALVVLVPKPASADEIHTKDSYALTAGFLHALPGYVVWPANPTETNSPPWRIGILSDDQFEGVIPDVPNQPVNRRSFVTVRSDNAEALVGCDVVYLAIKDEDKLAKALKVFAGRPTLTVGDSKNFLKAGGAVRITIASSIHFNLDLDHARAAGLKVKGGMVELADEVIQDGKLTKSRKK
jgi:hypothetical protein